MSSQREFSFHACPQRARIAVAALVCAGAAATVVTGNCLVVLWALATFEPPNIPDYRAWVFAYPVLAFVVLVLGGLAAFAWSLLVSALRRRRIPVGDTVGLHSAIVGVHAAAGVYAFETGTPWPSVLAEVAVVPFSLMAAVLSVCAVWRTR